MSQDAAARQGLTSPSISMSDDRRHTLENSALSRESLFFQVSIPEESLAALAYTWVDGAHQAGCTVLVFGDNDERLSQFSVQGIDVSPATDFDNWTVGPLVVQHGEPHRTAHVAFDHEGVTLDYTFEATTPAFSYRDNEDGCPAFFADNRLEQSGRVHGTIAIHDRVVPFDTTGHRDHSWGTRDWTAFHHWKWACVQAGSEIGINFTYGLALGRLFQWGYVDRDGVQAPIVSISGDVERDPDHYAYTSMAFSLVDALGRTTDFSAGRRSTFVRYPAGGMVLLDAAGLCEVAGLEGQVYLQEGWEPEYVERRKALSFADGDSDVTTRLLAMNKDVGRLSQ
ncbi:hypothetical protein N864_00235 [Intrasporangium chromatireducens Q5-1]|uniref:AttH domain-containing protein n=1 Tax=Intrasporangium chromatireducens Q5-1 TaxID=584657 RepID=W9GLV6_9MICO|nr:hypothetical protein [Intrasporangium chromatireducens]EWT06082.1 hypothetical protein N864_00235 [Intrasporangium chromatireducens Q5-1]